MLNTVAQFINPQAPACNPQVNSCVKDDAQSAGKRSLLSRIFDVAIFVFKAVAAAALYWINPNLFTVSVIVGIAADDYCDTIINKIINVWRFQPWAGTVVLGFAAWLSLPISLATAGVLLGAHIGSELYKSSIAQRQFSENNTLVM